MGAAKQLNMKVEQRNGGRDMIFPWICFCGTATCRSGEKRVHPGLWDLRIFCCRAARGQGVTV